ncbi:hypothetical protein HN51_001669 [Arachis hypogaea]
MKEAASIACQALLLTMLHSKTYPFESMLAAKVEYECRMKGAQRMGFNTEIVEFDSVKTILGMLEVSAEFALNITFNRDRIQKALPAGHLDATTLADYLVNKVKTCYSLALWWYLIVLMLYITVQVQI